MFTTKPDPMGLLSRPLVKTPPQGVRQLAPRKIGVSQARQDNRRSPVKTQAFIGPEMLNAAINKLLFFSFVGNHEAKSRLHFALPHLTPHPLITVVKLEKFFAKNPVEHQLNMKRLENMLNSRLANINERDEYGDTLLIHAIRAKNLDAVKLLLRSPKLAINQKGFCDNGALDTALFNSDSFIVSRSGATKAEIDPTALEILKAILTAGKERRLDVNLTNGRQQTPLHKALYHLKSWPTRQQLGVSPTHAQSTRNLIERQVKLLVEADADLDIKDAGGKSPRMIAKELGVQDLLKK